MRKACLDDSLAKRHPEVAKQWHYIKNYPITPKDIFSGCNTKFWWICSNGHEWLAQPNKRTFSGRNCPYCTNKKVCNDNCIATTHPHLLEEWNFNRNKITPKDITYGSIKKIWWICSKKHEWEMTPNDRTNNHGCPICSRANKPKSKGEVKVSNYLNSINLYFEPEYIFSNCKNARALRFDFAIIENNQVKFLIEYHGRQHYDKNGSFSQTKEEFEGILLRDKIKKEFCETNNIKLLVIPHTEYDNTERIIDEFIKRSN